MDKDRPATDRSVLASVREAGSNGREGRARNCAGAGARALEAASRCAPTYGIPGLGGAGIMRFKPGNFYL